MLTTKVTNDGRRRSVSYALGLVRAGSGNRHSDTSWDIFAESSGRWTRLGSEWRFPSAANSLYRCTFRRPGKLSQICSTQPPDAQTIKITRLKMFGTLADVAVPKANDTRAALSGRTPGPDICGSCVARPGCPGTAQHKILSQFTYLWNWIVRLRGKFDLYIGLHFTTSQVV